MSPSGDGRRAVHASSGMGGVARLGVVLVDDAGRVLPVSPTSPILSSLLRPASPHRPGEGKPADRPPDCTGLKASRRSRLSCSARRAAAASSIECAHRRSGELSPPPKFRGQSRSACRAALSSRPVSPEPCLCCTRARSVELKCRTSTGVTRTGRATAERRAHNRGYAQFIGGGVVLTAPSEQHDAWITAKGLRALGRPVPDDVDDDEVVILTYVEADT